MQQHQQNLHDSNIQAMNILAQQLLTTLEETLQHSYEPKSSTFRHILLCLPQEYQALGREVISERIVNDIKLHFLEMIAIFSEKAEQEGIEREDRDETLQDIRSLVLNLMQINRQLSIESLEDLINLMNITVGLQTLSKANSAERAQRWIYKIPTLYQERLEQQNLISQNIKLTVTFSVDRDWLAYKIWTINAPKVNFSQEVKVHQIKSLHADQYTIQAWEGKL